MNKASRTKNVNEIKFYGPLASALSFIISCRNDQVGEVDEEFAVYRGLTISSEELASKYKVGNTITLQGFTSTTIVRNVALRFATGGTSNQVEDSEKVPLLMEIRIKGDK